MAKITSKLTDSESQNIPFLKEMCILGFRGISEPQKISFAEPNGTDGSGLTIIVGANNSGKSTVLEALIETSGQIGMQTEFLPHMRNRATDDGVKIELTNSLQQKKTLSLCKGIAGGATHELSGDNFKPYPDKIFALKPRRILDDQFQRAGASRDGLALKVRNQHLMRDVATDISPRLWEIHDNDLTKIKFNNILGRLIVPSPDWTISINDQGDFYIRYIEGDYSHPSSGVGDGIITLFNITVALFDSKPGDVIAIDEPERSLHPSVQRYLKSLFIEYSRDRQIIISTHSPIFIDWQAIADGAKITRVVKESSGTKIYQLANSNNTKIQKLLLNINNPHIFGLNASEAFFLPDNIILLEGQEDVVILPKALEISGMNISGNFFGWGVGGAGNFELFCKIFKDLGYKKVVGILDKDQQEKSNTLKKKFRRFYFDTIATDDIRNKDAKKETSKKLGLTNNGKIKAEHLKHTGELVHAVNNYLSDPN